MHHQPWVSRVLIALSVWLLPLLAVAQLPDRNAYLRQCNERGSGLGGMLPTVLFERELEGSGVSMREWMEQCSLREQCVVPSEERHEGLSIPDGHDWSLEYCTACMDRRTVRALWLATAYSVDEVIAHPPASIRTAVRRYCNASWAYAETQHQWPPEPPHCSGQEPCAASMKRWEARLRDWQNGNVEKRINLTKSTQSLLAAMKKFWRNWLKRNQPSREPRNIEDIAREVWAQHF
jgi:hypothetical protein